jgi:hypothetical protein
MLTFQNQIYEYKLSASSTKVPTYKGFNNKHVAIFLLNE